MSVLYFGSRADRITSIAPAGSTAEERSDTRLPEEELVKRFIRNNSLAPREVEFLRWGPHMLDKDLAALFEEAGIEPAVEEKAGVAEVQELRPLSLVRVTYRDPNNTIMFSQFGGFLRTPERWNPEGDTFDRVFFAVGGKIVVPCGDNKQGDDWIELARKDLAKVFPAIDVRHR